jgi:hypothetical protein
MNSSTKLQAFFKAAIVLTIIIAGTHVINSSAFNSLNHASGSNEETDSVNASQPLSDLSREEYAVVAPESAEEQPFFSNINAFQETENDICAEAWHAVIQSPPEWLQTPVYAEQLKTEVPYALLAGQLIKNGVVDASECTNDGLLFNGNADACGLDKAMSAVITWQNQFDSAILDAARNNRVPAVLLKKLFAQETQFWPGTSWQIWEYGIGQATSFGLDPLFQYYPEYYQSTCPSVFSQATCQGGYASLSSDNQSLLRGYFALHYLNADCETCQAGIDLTVVTSSIDVFAKLLVANCHQINQVMLNLTKDPGGKSSSYEDLWRFTLANYNAGAGCVSDAITPLVTKDKKVSWENVANQLINLGYQCAASIDYVFEIAR